MLYYKIGNSLQRLTEHAQNESPTCGYNATTDLLRVLLYHASANLLLLQPQVTGAAGSGEDGKLKQPKHSIQTLVITKRSTIPYPDKICKKQDGDSKTERYIH